MDPLTHPHRPLRFCMVTTFYPPYSFGGDAVFVHRLANALAERGHSVDVIHNIDAYRLLAGREPSASYENHPAVRIHGLRTPFPLLSTVATQQLGSPALLPKQLKKLLHGSFDVIHFHNVSLMGAPEVLTYGSAIKLYTMHEYWLVCPTHVLHKFGRELCLSPQCFACTLHHKRPPQLWRYSGRLAAAAGHIDAFLGLHSFGLETHRRRGFDAPMHVLPPFVPRSPLPDPAPSGQPRSYFLYVGRLEHIKGLHTLLPLFESPGGAELWIAGDGSERPALERQAAGNPRIRFLGHISEPRLSQLYRGAIALVVPSLTWEIFGLVILEAFREKTPVLVRRIGALPDIVESAQAGYAWDSPSELAAQLRQLEAEPALRNHLGHNGYAAFEQRWTTEAHLDRYFSIIDTIARSRAQ